MQRGQSAPAGQPPLSSIEKLLLREILGIIQPVSFVIRREVIRIPESWKFLFVESGILGSGITNSALGIAKESRVSLAI